MSEIVSEAKKALRAKVQANRSLLLAEQTKDQFGKLLLDLAVSEGYRHIGCYLSFGSEPATDSFIALAKAQGLEIACPRIESDGQMVMASFLDTTVPSELGFRQPTGEVIQPKDLDSVVVPALAIDYEGKRLGRGAGYFDRYLQHYQGSVVGVVYDNEFIQKVPSLPHDQPVSVVVTQSQTISIPFER